MTPLQLLKWYRDMGVDEIAENIIRNGQSQVVKHIAPAANVKPLALEGVRDIVFSANDLAAKCTSVEALKEAVMNFDGCVLKKTATTTVFADGNPQAEIMLIGEAPGANEDVQGIPFCGDSGKLLDNMLKYIGLDRTNFYITNSIFWRPPGNRRPTSDEIAICLPFVEKHIALINPKLLILVGATAVSAVMNINEPISKIRGHFLQYTNQYLPKEVPVTAIFHPSYLLRQPSQKKIVWQDLLLIKQFMKSIKY